MGFDYSRWDNVADPADDADLKEIGIVRLLVDAMLKEDDERFFGVLQQVCDADATKLTELSAHSSVIGRMQRLSLDNAPNDDAWERCLRVLHHLCWENSELCSKLVDMGAVGLLFDFKLRSAQNAATTNMFAFLVEGMGKEEGQGADVIVNAFKNSEVLMKRFILLLKVAPLDEEFFIAGCGMLSLLAKDEECRRLFLCFEGLSTMACLVETDKLSLAMIDALKIAQCAFDAALRTC